MLYEVTLRGSYFGQEVINRWNYISTGTPSSVSGSFGLAYAFGAIPDGVPPLYPEDTPLGLICQLVSNQMTFSSMTVRAPREYAVTDFYEATFGAGLSGAQGGEATAPFNAWGWKSSITRTDIRRATKRLAGVCENQVNAGGVIPSGTLEFMQQIGDKFAEVLSYDDEGNTITYTPCVVGKEKYVTPKGNDAYRYYATLAEQLDHIATGITWQPYATVRTQNSRQYGRGA